MRALDLATGHDFIALQALMTVRTGKFKVGHSLAQLTLRHYF
jgi:hypothetical protein